MKRELSQRQTLEQMRAKAAWQRVNQIKEESRERQKKSKGKDKGSLEKEYRSRVRSLNSMIQINGLGSTLGFLKAKSNQNEVEKEKKDPNAPYLLLEHLTDWMRKRNFIPPSSESGKTNETVNPAQNTGGTKDTAKTAQEMNFEGYDGILNWIIDAASRDKYRQATTECLAFGLWLRRFAEAELASSSPQESNANAPQTTEDERANSTQPVENKAASNVGGTEQHG